MVIQGKTQIICDRCGSTQEVLCDTNEPTQVIVEANRQGDNGWELVDRSWVLCKHCAKEYHVLIDNQHQEVIKFIGKERPEYRYW